MTNKKTTKATPKQTDELPNDKNWDLTYPYDREGNRVDQPQPTPLYKTEPQTEPTQLDRIESLLVELVQTNRKLHPNISDLMGGFQTKR